MFVVLYVEVKFHFGGLVVLRRCAYRRLVHIDRERPRLELLVGVQKLFEIPKNHFGILVLLEHLKSNIKRRFLIFVFEWKVKGLMDGYDILVMAIGLVAHSIFDLGFLVNS